MRKVILGAVLGLLCLVSLGYGAVEKAPYLLFEGKNTQMTVMWQLTNSSSCTIEWGKTQSYEMGSKTTSEYGSDHQHKHTITGLEPNTMYYYSVDGVGSGSFRTSPEENAKKTKFIAYGDTRTYPSDHNNVAKQIVSRIKSDNSMQTCVLFSGDYVNKGYNESDWTNTFFPLSMSGIKELHSMMPNIGCIGNHEGTDGSSILRKYYPFPHVSGHYWAFDYGPARVYIVDQYTKSYSTGSSQHNWLKSDLSSTDKEWKIVVFHAPGYSAGGGHSNKTTVQNYLQPLFEDYGVDFVLNGDNHYYSRAEVNGVTHITTGGGGAPLYSPNSSAQYIKKADKSNHYCELDIDGFKATLTVRRASGSVVETITKEHEGPQYEITVNTPAGGEEYAPGAEVSVTWDDNIDEDVKIELLEGSSVVSTVESATASDGSYIWTVAESIDAGSYALRISSVSDASISDKSGTFAIIEAIDTTNPVDLMPIAGWAMDGDSDGSLFEMDTTKKADGTISASFELVKSSDAEKIYPWAKLSAWVSPGNLDSVTAIRVSYVSDEGIQVFLEDSSLSSDGTNYEYALPAATRANTVLLTPGMFKQPSWIADSQKVPLDLKEVNGVSFGSTTSEAKAIFEIQDLTLYNFKGIPDAVFIDQASVKQQGVTVRNGLLSITVGETPVRLMLLAVNGRVVMDKKFSTQGIHVMSLASLNLADGLYLYKTIQAGQSISGSLILK